MRALLILAAALPLLAQSPKWSASFVDQGRDVLRGALGQAPKGIVVYGAAICAGNDPVSLDAGEILRAAHSHGAVILDGAALDSALTSLDARSPGSILLMTSAALGVGSAVVVNTDLVKMQDADRKRWTAGIAAATGAVLIIKPFLDKGRIEPAAVRKFILPARLDLMGGRECWRGTLLGLPGPSVSFEVSQ